MNARTYLFALVDGGGNVSPELSAARRLVERGHLVIVLAEDSVAGEVRATGAMLRPWVHAPNRPDRRPEHDPARDWECRYPWQLIERLAGTLFVGPAPGYAQDVRDAIAETRPQLVVCSMFCLGGMVAAEAARLPFDVLLPNIYPLPAKGLPPFGIGLPPARGAGGRLRDRALNAFLERLWDSKGLAGLNALRRQHGVTPLPHFLDQARHARRQLVLTSRAFDFAAVLPAGARYVGPILDDPLWAAGVPWDPLPAAPRWSSWRCPRPSRTRLTVCNGWSTRWGPCPSGALSPPGPRSTHRRCGRTQTSRSCRAHRMAKCCRTRHSWSRMRGMERS
jgi:hypothetical protein